MNVPNWIVLAASSKEEKLETLMREIDEMGLEEAQQAIRDMAPTLEKRAQWVYAEKFITAADPNEGFLVDPVSPEEEKPVEKVRSVDLAPKKKVKPAAVPAEVSTPEVTPEVKPSPKPKASPKPKQEAKPAAPAEPSGSSKGALLLALLVGLGAGSYTTQQLQHLDLKKELLKSVSASEGKIHNKLVNWLEGKGATSKEPNTPAKTEITPDGTSPAAPQALPPERAEFIKTIREAASQVDMRGIPVEILIPLFALETGWGKGDIFQKTNNPGSIKSTDAWKGDTYQSTRVYPDLKAGIEGLVELLHKPMYAKALAAAQDADMNKFAEELEAAGYEVHLAGKSYSQRLKDFNAAGYSMDITDDTPSGDLFNASNTSEAIKWLSNGKESFTSSDKEPRRNWASYTATLLRSNLKEGLLYSAPERVVDDVMTHIDQLVAANKDSGEAASFAQSASRKQIQRYISAVAPKYMELHNKGAAADTPKERLDGYARAQLEDFYKE